MTDSSAFQQRIQRLEALIGYTFINRDLLKIALTHSPAAVNAKHPLPCNERVEFLGDAVLELVTSDYLYHRFPDTNEGLLSRMRAKMVCEPALYRMACFIDLPSCIRLGKGEEITGGRNKPSLVSDAFESVIGAIYLDGGMEPARAFITGFVIRPQEEMLLIDDAKDSKTLLQEYVQKEHLGCVSYRLTGEEGPDHQKMFTVEAMLDDAALGEGCGTSKRRAEEAAAQIALNKLRLKGSDGQ